MLRRTSIKICKETPILKIKNTAALFYLDLGLDLD
jgi:hypothetical protein